MIIINSKDAKVTEFRNGSLIAGIINKAQDSEVTIGSAVFGPNSRVPEEGFGVHDFDEYSFIIDGELEAQIEDQHVTLGPEQFSYIAEGEKHWSMNKTDKDCKLVWVSVKKIK
ncbi:MAG: cupin domain-containing protein [Eubacteriaceae bacterium]|nr:cupin domain-containing protein [Eubacteriaceae bacterium]